MQIPQPHFLLRNPKADKPTPINCHLRFNNERIIFPTGEKIVPLEWDFAKQRAINSKRFPHNSELNVWLDKIDTEIKSVFRGFNLDNVSPTSISIKEKIRDRVFNKTNNKLPSLLKFIESYIAECSKIKNPNTIKSYVTTYKHLKSYSEFHKTNLDYSSINLQFYNSFIEYLTYELNLSNNTLGKHVQVFKTFLNEATDRGYNKKMDFRSRKFKRPSEKVYSIYLNKEELKKMLDLDLKENPGLEKVRDLFIIACYTGLRYSDFTQIRPENIKTEEDHKFITLTTQKTSTKVVIPLHPIVVNILEKYNGTIPPPMSNQKMNDYVKIIGKMAGIDKDMAVTRTKGGKKIRSVVPKYMLIHTHTGRKSFATNAFLAGVPSISIMKITGHSTENQFLKYVKITEEQNASNLMDHEFFSI